MKSDYSKVVCYDMEMCCWDEGDRRVGEIISIGIVELCLLTGRKLRDAHYYVKPDEDRVSEFCTQLTGITPAMVSKQGRPLHKVLETIKQKFGGSKKTYVAWGNDTEYLGEQCKWKGIENPITTSINAALLYMIKVRHNGSQVSMVKAMEEAGLSFEGRQHNALVDATNLSRLVFAKNLL